MFTRAHRQLAVLVIAGVTAIAGLAGTWDKLVGGTTSAVEPAKFASSMPAGALVYVEARDLHGILQAWTTSSVRERYLASASFRSFTRSRLYLKLTDRITDLQAGFGIEFSDTWLAEIAGGPSAVSVYDPGKLELLLVTEVPRERALATTLFAAAKDFQERKTAKGVPYYSREVNTEGGTRTQRIAFAWNDGRLWVGTSDALLAEALDGPADGGLGTAVRETARVAGDFEAHDLTIWFDMDRTVRNKYFNLYWIQRNAKQLEDMASGLIDLRFAADGVHERRWFVRKPNAPAPSVADAKDLARLVAAAPPDAQLVEVSASQSDAGAMLATTMFGPERDTSSVRSVSFSSNNDSDDNENGENSVAMGRYAYLDDRFDRDVDDVSAAFPVVGPAKPAEPGPAFPAKLQEVVGGASPVRTAVYESVTLADKQLFAGVDRTVVLELSAPEKLSTAELERVVQAEYARRFVVGGNAQAVAWVAAGGSRSMAGGLTSQGGAYRLAGKDLIVSNSAANCDAVAARLASATPANPLSGSSSKIARVAEIRVANARGPFTNLMRVLDSQQIESVEEDATDSDEENNRPVLFFSENIVSLLDVLRDVTKVRIVTVVDGGVMREWVDYDLAPPTAPVAKPGARPKTD